jgi:hypothetical protein
VFLAVIRLQGRPPGADVTRLPGGRLTSTLFACLGFATTVAAVLLAAFPAPDEPNKLLAVIKILGLTTVLLGSGTLVYVLGQRSARQDT